jgi:prenyltransferase beta subunit
LVVLVPRNRLVQISRNTSLLAAADFVELLASLFHEPVEVIETVLWSALATGLALATLHLLTMLVTKWGDRSSGWKSLVFSILIHLSCMFGLVAVNPPDALSPATASESEVAVIPEQRIEVQTKSTQADEPVALPKSGNTRVWEKLPDAPAHELVRTNRSPVEMKPSEGPARTQQPLTAPDLEVTDKTALPDQPEVRPELKLSGENAPTRVEAAVPLKLDDPTAESRPETRLPSFAPLKRGQGTGSPGTTVARQANSNTAGGPERALPGFDSPGLLTLPESVVPGTTTTVSPAPAPGGKGAGPQRSGPAPSTLPSDEARSVASNSTGSGTGTGSGASGFSRLKTRSVRGQPGGGSETFHPERKAQDPAALTGGPLQVRDGVRTELPNEGLVPRLVQPNFEASKLGKRTTVPPIYEGRNLTRRREMLRKYGGTDASEKAVELSLRWLATHQNPEGFWDADGFDAQCPDGDRCTGHAGLVKIDEDGVDRLNAGKQADVGVTALALLAFLGYGYTHETGPYADQIDHTLSWMVRQQRADGYLGGKATHFEQMYCHAMATYALAEALGMQSDLSSDSRLREPVARAVNYIVDNQNPDGGWRYVKGQSSDMSIFGWQLMALKSAEIAGLTVPDSTKARMVQFLKERSQGPNKGLAGYRSVGGQLLPPTESMTAEALFCKQMLRLSRTDPASTEGMNYIMQRLPRGSTHNLYFWYYGTLAMYQYGGPQWREWNEALRETLIAEQRTRGHIAGSWDPKAPWGAYGGRIFSTAVSTLCLEVYYRFLPLYQMGEQYDGP